MQMQSQQARLVIWEALAVELSQLGLEYFTQLVKFSTILKLLKDLE